MILNNYKPAKNNVLLEEVKTLSSGNIELATNTTAGYFKVIAVGPLCEKTKVGDYIISALQFHTELTFIGGMKAQIPEAGIDGYYTPTKEELENPIPILKSNIEEEEEDFDVIDSEGGDNDLGGELGFREN